MLKNQPLNRNSMRSINLLVEALLELLQHQKLGDITISELTSQAGVVRNTYYAHFESKEDVLAYHMYEMFRSRIQLELRKTDKSSLELDRLYFEIWLENLAFLHILKNNQLMHLLNQFGNQFNLICGEFELNETCEVSKEAEPFANAIYADALASLVRRWIELGQKESPKELTQIFREFVR